MAHFLEELAGDVDRFVWAGAQAARGDAALTRQRTTLQAAGQKVPALAKAAEIATELATSDEARSGAALLQLNLAAAQLRVSQLKAESPAGDLAPLAPMDRVASLQPVPVQALYAVRDTLGSKKKPADSLLELLEGPELARDPRLWPGLVQALGNGYLRDTAVRVIGRIGPAIVPTLEAGFRKKGGEADAARLRAIGAIRREAGEKLYRDCLRTGSAEVKIAALACIAHVSLEEAENGAIALVEATAEEARFTLVAPLLRIGSPRLFDLLLDMAESDRDVAAQLKEHLAGAQLVQFAEHMRLRAQGGSKSLPTGLALEMLLELFVEKPTPAGDALMESLLVAPGRERQKAAAAALLERHVPELARRVIAWAPGVPDAEGLHAKAIFNLTPAEVYEHFLPHLRPLLPEPEPDVAPAPEERRGVFSKIANVFGPRSSPTPAPTRKRDEVRVVSPVVLAALEHLETNADPRWLPALLAMLPLQPVPAIKAFAAIGNPQAVPALVDIARRDAPGAAYAINALGVIRSREAVPALVELLVNPPSRERLTGLVGALMNIGDPAAVPGLQDVLMRWSGDQFVVAYTRTAIRKLQQ